MHHAGVKLTLEARDHEPFTETEDRAVGASSERPKVSAVSTVNLKGRSSEDLASHFTPDADATDSDDEVPHTCGGRRATIRILGLQTVK